MYLITAYFDNETNKRIQTLINHTAAATGNSFMTANHVPPHMTISSIEARNAEVLIPSVNNLRNTLHQGTIRFVSTGQLLPYVLYITPVLNAFLLELSNRVYDAVSEIPETTVSRYYRPLSWLPHVTIGKTLSKEQMRQAFATVQDKFAVFDGRITQIGLAKVNPHEDVLRYHI